MAVAVQAPREKKDPLTTIMQGLSIAKDIYGIKYDMDRTDALQKQSEAKAQSDSLTSQGVLKPREFQDLMAAGGREAKEGEPGAMKFSVGTDLTNIQPKFLIPAPVLAQQNAANKQTLEASAKVDSGADSLRDDFRNTVDKSEQAAGPQLRKINQFVGIYNHEGKATKSDDVAAINLFARMLSPGIVTNQDFENARRNGSLPEQVKAMLASVEGSGELTDPQRATMMQTVRNMAQGAMKEYDSTVSHYSEIAKSRKLDLDSVVSKGQRSLTKEVNNGFDSALKKLSADQFQVGQVISKGGRNYQYMGGDKWIDAPAQSVGATGIGATGGF